MYGRSIYGRDRYASIPQYGTSTPVPIGEAEFSFTATGSAHALATGTGTTSFSFAVAGIGLARAIGTGTSAASFAASGEGLATATGTGTAAIGFQASGIGSASATGTGTSEFAFEAAGLSQGYQGDSTFSFEAVGVGSAIKVGTGTSSFSMSATGEATATGTSTGTAVFGFEALGNSGGVVANFVGSPLSGETPLTVQFTDLSTGNPTSWLWDFGDGQTSTDQNPLHVYQAVGQFTVSLTVENLVGIDEEVKPDYMTVAAASVIVPGTGLNTNDGSKGGYLVPQGWNRTLYPGATSSLADFGVPTVDPMTEARRLKKKKTQEIIAALVALDMI